MGAAPDGQPGAGQSERSGLGFDSSLADLLVAVIQRQDPGGEPWRVLAVLGECRRDDQVLTDRQLLARPDLLFIMSMKL